MRARKGRYVGKTDINPPEPIMTPYYCEMCDRTVYENEEMMSRADGGYVCMECCEGSECASPVLCPDCELMVAENDD